MSRPAEAIDTTSSLPPPAPAPDAARSGAPPAPARAVAPPALPAGPPAAGTCRYYLSTRDARVYAVETRDGWVPTRVVGPFAGDQLRTDAGGQDWSAPADARGWDFATLVPLCEAERARLVGGADLHRRVRGPVGPLVRTPLPDRRLTDFPARPVPPVTADGGV